MSSEFIDIDHKLKDEYNLAVNHPLQSYEWGEFRNAEGTAIVRRARQQGKKLVDAFTLSLHPVPKLPFTIGYLPKTDVPSNELLNELEDIGKKHNCIFIQLEPNVLSSSDLPDRQAGLKVHSSKIKQAAHPLFTRYSFILDLTKSEDELLQNMHSKTRYNIRLATRKGVTAQEDNSDQAFKDYLRLTTETTERQKFYAHSLDYHRTQWKTLPHITDSNHSHLSSHLLTAVYNNEIVTSWIVFIFKDTLYYPYGASSNKYRNVMHSNLMMWEAIRFGKKQGLKKFDMWGALGPDPDTNDPWYGFHRFKEGYGPQHVEFIGSFDLVLNPLLYNGYKVADKLRWLYLRIKK